MRTTPIKKGGKGGSDSVLVSLVVLALLTMGAVGCGGFSRSTLNRPRREIVDKAY